MDIFVLIALALVIAMIVALAMLEQRRHPGRRGSEPGKGYHHLKSDYQSGVGGGNVKTWKVPRDPQEYARQFVPHSKSNASKDADQ
ncbi:hypothetical protein [Thalassococcus lentus]|uniref:Secreted protein n=1 Tax=Thalassococcus lentus TaxID=1210524 RepID=A0ABT4XR67_9RHOB|nr:hypothetical protein [Thalassococcus lentus]MDA7424444.1 hypothetical protein [Thalassococcus lentus]